MTNDDDEMINVSQTNNCAFRYVVSFSSYRGSLLPTKLLFDSVDLFKVVDLAVHVGVRVVGGAVGLAGP